ncbi:MAG: ribose-5-phosphate isomerase A [Clostridiaceae bacterium]|nr:ribose-5-phosphate isomerase A [Clostridiaceae bacterium]
MLYEKIVESLAKRVIWVVDSGKIVNNLASSLYRWRLFLLGIPTLSGVFKKQA